MFIPSEVCRCQREVLTAFSTQKNIAFGYRKKPGIATWLFYIYFHFSVIFFYVYICETYATLDTTKG